MAIVKVNKLNKTYGDLQVLKDFDLEVNQGDVIAIIGPSGSGKTTILKCLNFFERADSGTMEFDGVTHDLATITNKEIHDIRQRTGFVFQSFNLFLNKTALGNVMEGLIIGHKIPKDQAEKTAREMLDKVGMSERYDHYPSQMSGGQQQRVAIARALATDPEIIYLDEPTSALDPELINEVLSIIRQLAEEKRTMIIVTHEINFARNVANRIIFLEDGKVLADCPTEEFFTNQRDERIVSFIRSIDHNN
ncbi:MAG: amino acid ABC transporter ATP-binding protein [Erysipelotrichaceae bacterium]|nr:amino acid ABC transporter ATP-binding protein [Erysipelotrichaceae bacterium]